MKKIDKKIRTEHTIMDEFVNFLNDIAKNIYIHRLIPGRITRKQSGASDIYINLAYHTHSGLKYNMKKGSTSQEVFVICDVRQIDNVSEYIYDLIQKYATNK